ncbi:nuclear transport factor 2 family protein [Kitasatospora sp. NPDC001175]|uniref:nuclear transport factor 2 family protein n=1 Tax=Kitasatospora sp. NPDC001175 TaxID=3157103 RepID=UPI003CFFF7FE
MSAPTASPSPSPSPSPFPFPSASALAPAVAAFFEGSRSGDPDAWAASFAPDAEYHDPVGTPVLAGRAAIRDQFAAVLPLFGRFDGIRPDRVHGGGDEMAVTWRGAGETPDGRPVAWEGVNVFALGADGLIAHCRAYFDLASVLAQLAPEVSE